MKILVIGKRSFLSKEINSTLPNSKIISTALINNKKIIKKYIKDNTTLVINSFYPLFKILKNEINKEKMIRESVFNLIKLLKLLNKKKNIKIIYSSTCAVKDFNTDINNTRSFYTSVKIICEQILLEFYNNNKCQLIITRLFNLYGGDDKASIIYKLLKANKKKPLKIYNNGNSKRDFIHVSDVSKIYKNLIKSNYSGIIEIGTGKTTQIKKLINLKQNKYIISKKKIKESKISKANTKVLSKFYNLNKLIKVKDFIKLKQ